MSFMETLKKLAGEAAKSKMGPPGGKFLTPRLVHRIGWSIGIPTQNNPDFEDFAKHITGKADLREMTQWQLQALVKAMGHLKGSYSRVMLP